MTTHSKILVIGHARHGKDTVCELLRDRYGFTFVSSSEFCSEKLLFPLLKDKYGYSTARECFKDRGNHRAEWFDAIAEFNRGDPTRLGRAIWAENDIYCGLRNADEWRALSSQRLYDFGIWVDAGKRVPKEDYSSMTLESWMADHVLDNSGSTKELEARLHQLMTSLGYAVKAA